MADVSFPKDKEPGTVPNVELPDQTDDENEATPRQTAFLLVSLWATWLVYNILDTLREIDERTWSWRPRSQMQDYVYRKQWDLLIYRYDRFGLISDPSMLSQMCIVVLTLAGLLTYAMYRITIRRDANASSLIDVLGILSVFLAAWLGVEEREAGLIFIPFAALSAMTIATSLRYLGVHNIGASLGLSERVLKWSRKVTFPLVVVAYSLLFRFQTEFFAMMVLWKGFGIVYKRLG